MGRGHESQVRVNDISVSRTHALIKFRKDEGIFLSDNKSKFGTLVLMRDNSIPLHKAENYLFQIGRTVISMRVTEKVSDLSKGRGSSVDHDELSSVEHGQTEPFCSSHSSQEDNNEANYQANLNPENKRCLTSSHDAARLMQSHTQNDRESLDER